MKFNRKLIHPIVAGAVTLGVFGGLIFGNVLCYQNQNVITAYLCGQGFKDDTEESKAAREQGMALAEDVVEQGAVLLKNNNNVLPLTGEKPKVNVFGWAGSDNGFLVQGTGSGTGSRNDLVTFYGGLREAGFQINEELASAYNELSFRRVNGGSYVIEAYSEELYDNFYGVTEADDSFLNDERINQAKGFSDTAIIVIGRLLGEGNDYSKKQYISTGEDDETRKLQSISAREEQMIAKVCANFDKVILVTNTTNPMEGSFIENDKIDAVIHMGTPGTRGTIGLANIIKGKVSPSGHLADTWAYDLSTAASYATSGREGVGSYLDISPDTSLGTRANKYSEYLEDIYVGYQWYETADAEGFWDSDFAKETWGIENGYEDVVQFPFGYGLSYTTFDWTVDLEKTELANNQVLAKDGTIKIVVNVTNTGTVPGRDVVQLYYSAPYTKGGIEKSAIRLGAFAKTGEIQPGEYGVVELEMKVEDMRSYDCYDKNNNGFMGYELEGGDYTLSLRTDAHTIKDMGMNSTYTVKVPNEGFKYEVDSTTNYKIENQFTNYKNTTSGASSTIDDSLTFKAHSIDGSENAGDKPVYLTRSDFASTFPLEKPKNKNAESLIADMHNSRVTYPSDDSITKAPIFNSDETNWVIQDLYGVDYNDPMWDEIVSQLSIETCATLVARGGFGTIEIPEIEKDRTSETDGPSGFNNNVIGNNGLRAVCYPSSTILAQTFDWWMAYQVGQSIGIEGQALGITGWYGPGANLHRSPMGGRNFEYYSEDPRLAGIMCGYHVLGAKEKGVTAYIKHFGPNELESGRNGAYKWLTEQSLRENYLLPFELAVKIGKSNAMMSSVDRVGGERVSGSHALLTEVLRNEWGFHGSVITDYYQAANVSGTGHTIHDVDECIRAGNDLLLHPDGNTSWFDDLSSKEGLQALHDSAKNILYNYADTRNYAETAQGLEKGELSGTTTDVFAWWIPLLISLDVVIVLGMLSWTGLATYFALRKKKDDANKEDSVTE